MISQKNFLITQKHILGFTQMAKVELRYPKKTLSTTTMKWTYSIQNKLAASAALFALCVLVLFSNHIDQNHTERVKNAISTLYEDRLIAEEYILKMTSGFYQVKEVLQANTDHGNRLEDCRNLIVNIKEEYNAYQKTKLTDAEKIQSDVLSGIIKELEANILENTPIQMASAHKAHVILNELSSIQLQESKQIIDHAEELYVSGKTSSQFVFAIIIVILIVLQALVFASKTLSQNHKSDASRMN